MRGMPTLPRPVEWLTTAGTSRDQWLAARRAGIGGSDVPVILGTSPFRTPWQLWAEKTGATEPEQNLGEAVEWGNTLEPVVAREWAKRTGMALRRAGSCADPDHPHRIASIDRLVCDPGRRTPTALLEIKTTSHTAAGHTNQQLAARYSTQIQWYLGITGLPHAELAVLIAGQQLRTISIDADPGWYQYAAEKVDAWWERHVIGGDPPPILTPSQETVTADPETLALIDRLHELRARIETDKAEANWIQTEKLQPLLAQQTDLIAPDGQKLATWRPSTTTRIDTAQLRKDHPDLIAAYTKQTKIRTFRLTKKAAE